MSKGDLTMAAVLPAGVNTIEYTRNHHFIRFGRKSGEETKLIPSDMVLYFCDSACDFEMLTDYNRGALHCPVCKGPMQARWMKKQTCFIPEKESDFEWPENSQS
jgi:hypothetical protein